jgi:hypothetical protein
MGERRRYEEERRYEGERRREREYEGGGERRREREREFEREGDFSERRSGSYRDRELREEEQEIRHERGRRRGRKRDERMIEFITIALVLVIFVLFTNSTAAVSLFGGIVFTVSGLYQSSRRMRVNPLTWIAGIGMIIVGILSIENGDHITFLLPVLVFGGVIFGSFATGEL